ncbi:ABC-F family ATP-binding cassette domain-containing protein [Vagococcus silagei]|uniref:ABC-F family ATP-binding cassette domain-containing protein n=1 Tax=Vagococcus silagei TaxID=2508885 RepID=A0A4S3B2E8_9ENTE|nr:ABC-F family ATP-binding cassette domain-containing protein [Vagococcus silagei]
MIFLIQFKNIKYYVSDRLLLSSKEVKLEPGKVIGIVGPNGSGKTTLLNLIAGRIELDNGSLEVQGAVSEISQFIDTETSRSGGEQTKEKIRTAFSEQTTILLADEPTNHLDEDGIKFLKNKMKRYSGTILIVSHNRSFLNDVCQEILAIESSELVLYTGNYDQYLQEKELRKQRQKDLYAQYQNEKSRLEESVAVTMDKSAQTKKAPSRMGNSEARLHKRGKGTIAKATLARQAKTIEKRISQLEKVEKIYEEKPLHIPFAEGNVVHHPILVKGNDLTLSRGNKSLLTQANFEFKTGERTAIIGKNGCGKTTLLEEIMNGNENIEVRQTARFTFLSQSFSELNEQDTIMDTVIEASIYDEQTSRDLLAHLLFKGSAVYKKISVLSGGERTKLVIAMMILSENNCLVLDEPTNHLDIETLEVLESALKAYQGSIIFVSHDDYFVKQVANRVFEFIDGQLVEKRENDSQLNEQLLILELRKTELISQLSLPQSVETKERLEKEFQEVLTAIRMI